MPVGLHSLPRECAILGWGFHLAQSGGSGSPPRVGSVFPRAAQYAEGGGAPPSNCDAASFPNSLKDPVLCSKNTKENGPQIACCVVLEQLLLMLFHTLSVRI